MVGQTVKIACIAFSFFMLAQASYAFVPIVEIKPLTVEEMRRQDACPLIASEALSGIPDPPEQHLKNLKLCNAADSGTCHATIEFMRRQGNKSVTGLNCDGK
jgi:hypothetical protein